MTLPTPVPIGESLTIVLPLPNKILSPNARPHWAAKAKAVKAHRRDAWLLCCSTLSQNRRWTKATIQYTFYWKSKNKRDDDNAVAMCKAYRDGIADSGVVVNDSAFSTLAPVMLHDKKNPRVEICITQVIEPSTMKE